jgi:hypothetical protein
MSTIGVSHEVPRRAMSTPARLTPRPRPLGQLMRSFDRSLRALNRSAPPASNTFSVWVTCAITSPNGGCPTNRPKITRQHVEMFLAEFAETQA